MRFAIESTARLDAVETPINVKLEKNAGMVSRPARRCWLHPREVQESKVKFVHEYIDLALESTCSPLALMVPAAPKRRRIRFFVTGS